MRPKEMYELVDSFAPFALSRAYCEKIQGYDNSGLLLDCGKDAECILFSLDLSKAAVEEAKRIGAGLIVTHHPAIYAPLKNLTPDGAGASILMAAGAGPPAPPRPRSRPPRRRRAHPRRQRCLLPERPGYAAFPGSPFGLSLKRRC